MTTLPSAFISRRLRTVPASDPVRKSTPWALTEMVPPTLSTSMLGMPLTDSPCGWSASSTCPHRAPPPTRTVPDAASTAIRFIAVMSMANAPGHDAWPPMLCRAPATDTFSSCSRANATARPSSASLLGRTTPYTSVRFRQLASLTVPLRWLSQSG